MLSRFGFSQVIGVPMNMFFEGYPLVAKDGWLENPLYLEVLIGESLINGPFSIATFGYRRVRIAVHTPIWVVFLTDSCLLKWSNSHHVPQALGWNWHAATQQDP